MCKVSVIIPNYNGKKYLKDCLDAMEGQSFRDFEVLLDENGDFKRAMNVVNPPHVFVVDGQGNVVYQHNGYSDGSEQELIEVVRKLNAGEPIEKP